jgi:multidrug resistance protein MdtO
VGRLVDIAANLTQLSFEPSSADQKRFGEMASTLATVRADLINRRIPATIQFNPDHELSRGVPLLHEMEDTVSLIPDAFTGSRAIDEYLPPSGDIPRWKPLAPDALDNPEHLKFALKGCLAASLCYVIYNSIAWPGISTAVTTCLLTALTTIGSSRQKQILRFAGAIVGGFLLGMGAQIFILPHLDSITGFTVLFVVVTALSWFLTSSPRLSYFGLQVALAFYLINLQEFAFQTSLAVARDRVVGILLGLSVMWLVFDQLWSASAALEMKRKFISTVRLLAQLVREPLSTDQSVAWERVYSLRETINNGFDQIRALADGVLFEFGPSRQQDLALRKRILRWQPQARMLFLTEIALWKYRAQIPGFELPFAQLTQQRQFDEGFALMLEGMADRIEGRSSKFPSFEDSVAHHEGDAEAYAKTPEQTFSDQDSALLSLRHRVQNLTASLTQEI